MKTKIKVLFLTLLVVLLAACNSVENDYSTTITDSTVTVDESVNTDNSTTETTTTENSNNTTTETTTNTTETSTTTEPITTGTEAPGTGTSTPPVVPTQTLDGERFILAANKVDVWIDNDYAKLFSDYDNEQELRESLLYSDLYNLVGISISPMSTLAASELSYVQDVVRDVKLDQLRAKGFKYPSEAYVLNRLHVGAGSDEMGVTSTSPAVNALIAAAHASGNLYVMLGGKSTVLSAAIAADPTILPKIKVHAVASWNRTIAPLPLADLEARAASGSLVLTVDDSTHRASHIDAAGVDPQYTMLGFYNTHIKPYSSGYPSGYPANYPNAGVAGVVMGRKNGDGVQILRVVDNARNGGALSPLAPNWGGQFQQLSAGYYTDLPTETAAYATVQTHKPVSLDYLAKMFKRYSYL